MTPTAVLTLDRNAVPLSESVRATVAVEGPAPLVVAAPKELLAGGSAEAWRVRPAGPAAVEQLPGGRERWVQAYRLDPYVPGEKVPVAFAPFEVTAGGGPAVRLTVEPRDVHVSTALKEPKAADARPVTGIEELPPVPAGGSELTAAAGVVGALFVASLAVVLWMRRRFRSPVVTPADWANHEFADLADRLAAGTITPERFAERLAAAVRTFTQRRYGLPATRMTTAELAAAEPAPPADVLPILERCDLAKFAGLEPTADECREMLAAARTVIAAGGAVDAPRAVVPRG
jgi:hypothetical protein